MHPHMRARRVPPGTTPLANPAMGVAGPAEEEGGDVQ